MTIRERLFNLLLEDEGLRLKVYKCSRGKWTIGIGRNVEDKGITENEAYGLCHNDITEVMDDLDVLTPRIESLSEARKLALYSMRFQLGHRGFRGFQKMIAALDEGDFAKTAREMLDSKWAKQDSPERALRLAAMMKTGM